MSNMNIADWMPEDVAEWMSGLGPVVEQYIPLFRARGVHGKKLLQLRCDDLETLGMRCIGHQELLLEAVEHLRHFHYECKRECLQQVALRVATSAGSLARSLSDENSRLSTQTLADVATFLRQLKPLACWLERCVSSESWHGSQVRAALLRFGLEAATSAQRDRFAEQPARAVAAAAADAAALATHIMQNVTDSAILSPAAMTTVTLPLSGRVMGFNPSPRQLALREGDDILQVGGRCVIGWSGRAVAALCAAGAGAGGGGPRNQPRLLLRRAPAHKQHTPAHLRSLRHELCRIRASSGRNHTSSGTSSDESEALSPPASPEHHTKRMFAPRPLRALQRRHTISGAPPQHPLHQFWRDLKNQKLLEYTSSTQDNVDCDALYRRDKAVSYSTGLELTPRPNTCLGVDFNHPILQRLMPKSPVEMHKARGKKLDKSQSTPAYDFNNVDDPGPLVTQIIPESPTTPNDSPQIFVHSAEKAEQILDFKKCSSVIEEAIMHQQNKKSDDDTSKFTFGKIDEAPEESQVIETLNIAMIKSKEANRLSLYRQQPESPMKTFSKNDHMKAIQNEIVQSIGDKLITNDYPPEPPPRPTISHKPIIREPNYEQKVPIMEYPSLKTVRTIDNESKEHSPLKPLKLSDPSQISLPIRHITKHDIRVVSNDRRELPALNSESQLALLESSSPQPTVPSPPVKTPTHGKSLFPTVKSLKKKNTLLAKRRLVAHAAAARLAGAVAGALWVRSSRAGAPRWAPRRAVLAATALRLYRDTQSNRALILFVISGATASPAPEVRSREHAFKIYRGARTLYLAAECSEDMTRWIQAIQQSANHDPHGTWGSEAEYSATSSSSEGDDNAQTSKFHSLKKLTNRVSSSSEQLSSSSLDRKYLRIFSRYISKDDTKHKESKKQKEEAKKNKSPVPTAHYRSYRRVSSTPGPPAAPPIVPSPPEPLTLPPPPAPYAPLSPASPVSPVSPDDTKHDGTSMRKKKEPPKPINYIHASNPNLLDFEKTDFVTKTMKLVAPPKVAACDNFAGCVNLKEFMLQKQREERQEVYSNRVLLGIERDNRETAKEESKQNAKDLQKEWDRIVPDIIYGELPTQEQVPVPQIQKRSLPKTPERKESSKKPPEGVPISVTGKDGYEKIIYTVGDKSPKPADEPPKILPKKPFIERKVSPERPRKTSLATAKELGYELLYESKDEAPSISREVNRVPLPERRSSEGKPVPPPKSQLALNRQNSLTAKSGVDTNPVFLQGDSPEKFWLNSLKRQDKNPPPAPARPPPLPVSSVNRLRHVFTSSQQQPQPCQEPASWREPQYPHLQCPPVFRPETYSLRRRDD